MTRQALQTDSAMLNAMEQAILGLRQLFAGTVLHICSACVRHSQLQWKTLHRFFCT